MIYKSFTIKNFKGVESAAINLANNRIITLVGLNESGKTTIMEAIELFYQMIRGAAPSSEQLHGFRPKGIAFTGAIEIAGSLILEDEDKIRIKEHWKKELRKRTELQLSDEFTYTFKFEFELHTYKRTAQTCSFNVRTERASKSLYWTNKTGWQQVVDFIKNDIVPEVLYYDDFIFQIPDRIYFQATGAPEAPSVDETNNETWQLVIDDILNSVDSRMSFQEHVVDIWETDRDAANNRLAQMEKVLDEKITTRWGDLFGRNRVNFKEIKLQPEYSENKLLLSFRIRTQSKHEFLVNERSKGFKWFFSFLLFTEFRKKRTRNILFLLDEPASNLHSSAQAKILDAISELSKDSLVIYSTHSHHLIDPKWLGGAHICINENLSAGILEGNLDLSEGAKIAAIKYYTYVGKGLGDDKFSYFQPILDRLDYQPSVVEPIPNIVILEGKNDWYTLKYFEQVILKRLEKLNFYPGAGKDKLYDIIRLYLAWGKYFVVLLDGDDGVKSKKRYIKEFGEYVENRIYTIRDVLNKPVAMEGLMGTMDQRMIYDAVFGKGNYDQIKRKQPKRLKENLNLALNQLLIQNQELKLHQTTKDNFGKLLDFLANRTS